MSSAGFVHEVVLLPPIEACLIGLGARTSREHHAGPGREAGYVDLYAEWPNFSACIEAEMTSRRVLGDVKKAILLKADLLLIVVPDCSVRASCRRRLKAILGKNGDPKIEIWVLTLKPAIQRLTELKDKRTLSNVLNPKIPKPRKKS